VSTVNSYRRFGETCIYPRGQACLILRMKFLNLKNSYMSIDVACRTCMLESMEKIYK
jgi:hypothetical protein